MAIAPTHITRRHALHLMVGGAAAAAVAVAGCGSDEPSASDHDSQATDTNETGDAGGGENVVLYASPSCGCCGQYADYLGAEGYTVDLQRTEDLDQIRSDAGVPEDAAGCHTTMIGDYVIEGHVPIEAITKILQEQPAIDGISLPGMPMGSPGMSGTKEGSFEILSFTDGTVEPYTTI
jgi:hypothetical protein